LEVLRVAGSAIHGILQSPHGVAVDALVTGALTQPAYAHVSGSLKQRFVATVHINMGNEHKFCSFVRDFALVRICPLPSSPSSPLSSCCSRCIALSPPPFRFAGRRSPKTASSHTRRPRRQEQHRAWCIPAGGTCWEIEWHFINLAPKQNQYSRHAPVPRSRVL
jgi:hypothetical protein